MGFYASFMYIKLWCEQPNFIPSPVLSQVLPNLCRQYKGWSDKIPLETLIIAWRVTRFTSLSQDKCIMDIKLSSHSSKIRFSSAFVVHICSLLTRQKVDIGRVQEQPANSCSTTAKEVFSTGVVVIVINLENSPCSEAPQKSHLCEHHEQGWAETGLELW